MLIALSLLTIIKFRTQGGTVRQNLNPSQPDHALLVKRPSLDEVLNEAVRIAGDIGNVTLAQMNTTVRYAPTKYEVGLRQILELYQSGHVVSLDLSRVDSNGAIQLVNYCTGVVAISQGAMFRLATQVVMLIPPYEKLG